MPFGSFIERCHMCIFNIYIIMYFGRPMHINVMYIKQWPSIRFALHLQCFCCLSLANVVHAVAQSVSVFRMVHWLNCLWNQRTIEACYVLRTLFYVKHCLCFKYRISPIPNRIKLLSYIRLLLAFTWCNTNIRICFINTDIFCCSFQSVSTLPQRSMNN